MKLNNLKLKVFSIIAISGTLLPLVSAQITFKDSPSHYGYRYGMDHSPGGFGSRTTEGYQVVIVEVGTPSGTLPSTYDFYAAGSPNSISNESEEPKTPNVPINVLSSTIPLSSPYLVPLVTLMRMSDIDPLTPGTRLILVFKQENATTPNQLTVYDAFKTTQSALAQSSNAFVRIQLSLAQALQGSKVLAGCRLLGWLWSDTTATGGQASQGDGWHIDGEITPIQQVMMQAALSAPPFLSFAIYKDLDNSNIPGIFEPMVRSYLKLTQDPQAWQMNGSERGSYGKVGEGNFSELSLMVQAVAGDKSPLLLPDPNLWETAVLGGTNVDATRRVLHTFCRYALIGSQQNETKMMGLLDSPDESIRTFAAAHFAAISGIYPQELWDAEEESNTTSANRESDLKK